MHYGSQCIMGLNALWVLMHYGSQCIMGLHISLIKISIILDAFKHISCQEYIARWPPIFS